MPAFPRSLAGLALMLLVACADREYESPGVPADAVRPVAAAAEGQGKQVLFGDLHVHTTYSMDAFQQSLSFMGGEGAHPPADACDYARFCSQLDFWSINDHALSLTPSRWRATRETLRACNASNGGAPDTVAFLGWEWTQVGATPDSHYGHRNVVLPDLDDASLPPRPISAFSGNPEFLVQVDIAALVTSPLRGVLFDAGHRRDHWRSLQYMAAGAEAAPCDAALPPAELPADCAESAQTPAELFRRLDAVVDDYLVIPHGNSWGMYTPPGSGWRKQLTGAMHDPERQNLIEVYSGHGNSEEYRPWRGVAFDDDGRAYCPSPRDGYLPCCWQAGEIIRSRCDHPRSMDCEQQVAEARENAVAAGASGHLTVEGIRQEEWLNCGVCEDCFLPAFNYRPGSSVQAALATADFSDAQPRHFQFGFIASSDNHTARPGTGYKQLQRRRTVDFIGDVAAPERDGRPVRSVPPGEVEVEVGNLFNTERGVSMLYTGGLAAVHSDGRDRQSIWAALRRGEVFGTSGPRISVWFDYLGPDDTRYPMGSEVSSSDEPRFQVRALGARRQRPGCPDFAAQALGEARLERLCGNECYHPGDARQPITRIEVIKIHPQRSPDELIEQLVEDPWRVFECPESSEGCEVSFSDPLYRTEGRSAVYYVRALQAPTPTINGAGLRCERDGQGRCVAVRPCYGHGGTDIDDDCLAPVSHRAWSSPIYLRPGG
jgi:hypothetical protein